MAKRGESRSGLILIVDDEVEFCKELGSFLTRRGFEVRLAHDGDAALSMMERDRPDVLLLDLHVPKKDGLQVLQSMQLRGLDIPVIAMSGVRKEQEGRKALALGARDVLMKPVDLRHLETVVSLVMLEREISVGSFADGPTASASYPDFLEGKALGDRLRHMEFIDSAQLTKGLEEQRTTGDLLGKTLLRLGYITEDELTLALAQQAKLPYADPRDFSVDPAVARLIPARVAREHLLIPLRRKGDVLQVAMANANDVVALDMVRRLARSEVEPVFAKETDLLGAIERIYGTQGEEAGASVKAEVPDEALEPEEGEVSVIQIVDRLLTGALRERATDIHIEPDEKTVRIRVRIDGTLVPRGAHPKRLQAGILTRLKILGSLDIAESRLPQDGRFTFVQGGRKINIRAATFPSVHGENMVLRLLDPAQLILGLESLGFSERNQGIFRRLIEKPYGIVLVSGPTGCGKTTTLYAALSHINAMEKKIITIEDPVEYELPAIRQSQINLKAGMTFAAGMRAILRQDPDVILVGEVRDSETMEMAVRASLTGHLVFSTLHTNNAVSVVPRLLDMGTEPFLLSSSLLAGISQRLVRVLCPACKEESSPDPEVVERLGLDDGWLRRSVYKTRGCAQCNRTGFKGRTALFEIMVVNEEIREFINQRADSGRLSQAALRAGMKTMKEDGLEKVKAGITPLEEVLRETG